MVFFWRTAHLSHATADSGSTAATVRHTKTVVTVVKNQGKNHAASTAQAPASFWIHDDGRSNASQQDHACHRGLLARFLHLNQRKRILITLASFVLVLVVIILGAVLGTQTGKRKSSEPVTPPEPPGSDTQPDHPPDAQSLDPKDYGQLPVHAASQISTVKVRRGTVITQLVVFQDAQGDIVVMEWRNQHFEVYRLHERTDKKSMLIPAPALGSPLYLSSLSVEDEIHLVYLDKTRHLVHAIQLESHEPPYSWTLGALSRDDGKDLKPAIEEMRLSAAVFPRSEVSGNLSYELALLYQIESRHPTFTFLINSSPINEKWITRTFTVDRDMLIIQKGSPGFIVMPYHESTSRRFRIYWDLSNKNGPTTLGVMDCHVRGSREISCEKAPANWLHTNHHRVFLSAPKPFRISVAKYLKTSEDGMPRYVVSVLDASGNYRELFWDGASWADFEDFRIDSDKPYTNVATSDDDLVFGVSEGKIKWFTRPGDWWRRGSHPTQSSQMGEACPGCARL